MSLMFIPIQNIYSFINDMRSIEMKGDPLYKVLQIHSNDFMSFDSLLWPHMALFSIYFHHVFTALNDDRDKSAYWDFFFYFRTYHTLGNENFVKWYLIFVVLGNFSNIWRYSYCKSKTAHLKLSATARNYFIVCHINTTWWWYVY